MGEATAIPHVDADISDMFFNLDHSDAVTKDHAGNFVGWDRATMRRQAKWFVETIESISYREPPSVDAILADFYGRV